jgi:Polysaccharide biosynthesis protein
MEKKEHYGLHIHISTKVLAGAAGVVAGALYARRLTPTYIGELALIAAFISMLNPISDLGTNGVITWRIYKDREKWYASSRVLTWLCVAIGWIIVSTMWWVTQKNSKFLLLGETCLFIDLLAGLIDNKANNLYLQNHSLKEKVRIDGIFSIVGSCMRVVMMVLITDPWTIIISTYAIGLSTISMKAIAIRSLLPKINSKLSFDAFKILFKEGLIILPGSYIDVITTSLPTFWLAHFLGKSSLGLFEIANKGKWALTTSAAIIYERNFKEPSIKKAIKFGIFSCGVGLAYTLAIPYIYSDKYKEAVPIGISLLLVWMFTLISQTINTKIFKHEMPKLYTIANLVHISTMGSGFIIMKLMGVNTIYSVVFCMTIGILAKIVAQLLLFHKRASTKIDQK